MEEEEEEVYSSLSLLSSPIARGASKDVLISMGLKPNSDGLPQSTPSDLPHPFPQLDAAPPVSSLIDEDAPFASSSNDLLTSLLLTDLVNPNDQLDGQDDDGLQGIGMSSGNTLGSAAASESEATMTTTSSSEFDPDSFLNVGVKDLTKMPAPMEDDDDEDDDTNSRPSFFSAANSFVSLPSEIHVPQPASTSFFSSSSDYRGSSGSPIGPLQQHNHGCCSPHSGHQPHRTESQSPHPQFGPFDPRHPYPINQGSSVGHDHHPYSPHQHPHHQYYQTQQTPYHQNQSPCCPSPRFAGHHPPTMFHSSLGQPGTPPPPPPLGHSFSNHPHTQQSCCPPVASDPHDYHSSTPPRSHLHDHHPHPHHPQHHSCGCVGTPFRKFEGEIVIKDEKPEVIVVSGDEDEGDSTSKKKTKKCVEKMEVDGTARDCKPETDATSFAESATGPATSAVISGTSAAFSTPARLVDKVDTEPASPGIHLVRECWRPSQSLQTAIETPAAIKTDPDAPQASPIPPHATSPAVDKAEPGSPGIYLVRECWQASQESTSNHSVVIKTEPTSNDAVTQAGSSSDASITAAMAAPVQIKQEVISDEPEIVFVKQSPSRFVKSAGSAPSLPGITAIKKPVGPKEVPHLMELAQPSGNSGIVVGMEIDRKPDLVSLESSSTDFSGEKVVPDNVDLPTEIMEPVIVKIEENSSPIAVADENANSMKFDAYQINASVSASKITSNATATPSTRTSTSVSAGPLIQRIVTPPPPPPVDAIRSVAYLLTRERRASKEGTPPTPPSVGANVLKPAFKNAVTFCPSKSQSNALPEPSLPPEESYTPVASATHFIHPEVVVSPSSTSSMAYRTPTALGLVDYDDSASSESEAEEEVKKSGVKYFVAPKAKVPTGPSTEEETTEEDDGNKARPEGTKPESSSEEEEESSEEEAGEGAVDSESDLSDLETKKKVKTTNPKPFPNGYHRTYGELTLDDLPRIEDLRITVPEKEPVYAIGTVDKIIDRLVIIHSFKDLEAALDEDSVLLLQNRSVIGKVYETFGSVPQPYYSVRFNSGDEIKERGIIIGTVAYFAPQRSELTKFVFLRQLQKMKGSDASWLEDNEPPHECVDYSDDEAEQHAKRERKKKERAERGEEMGDSEEEEARERKKLKHDLKRKKWEEKKERKQEMAERGFGRGRYHSRGGGERGSPGRSSMRDNSEMNGGRDGSRGRGGGGGPNAGENGRGGMNNGGRGSPGRGSSFSPVRSNSFVTQGNPFNNFYAATSPFPANSSFAGSSSFTSTTSFSAIARLREQSNPADLYPPGTEFNRDSNQNNSDSNRNQFPNPFMGSMYSMTSLPPPPPPPPPGP